MKVNVASKSTEYISHFVKICQLNQASTASQFKSPYAFFQLFSSGCSKNLPTQLGMNDMYSMSAAPLFYSFVLFTSLSDIVYVEDVHKSARWYENSLPPSLLRSFNRLSRIKNLKNVISPITTQFLVYSTRSTPAKATRKWTGVILRDRLIHTTLNVSPQSDQTDATWLNSPIIKRQIKTHVRRHNSW